MNGPGDSSSLAAALPSNLLRLAVAGKETLCSSTGVRISIGLATCGRAAEALTISQKLAARQNWEGVVRVVSVGCLGACYAEPLVAVRTPDGKHYFFGKVDSKSLWHIIRTAQEASPSSSYLWAIAKERQTGILRSVQDLEIIKAENPGFAEFFRPQMRRISGRCGLVDPENLSEYVAMGGYFALARAIFQLQPKDVIAMITAAGLRGRGGGGFLAGKKWEIGARSSDPIRIMVVNADEGDPGAYMDRALLESDPHSVLEGLILAGYAVGATQAYIFVRHEYPLAVRALRQAIASARKAGLLGRHILGSDFSLDIALVESAGAFVCGEETSLLQVIAGKRGEPYRRPPYPVTSGLWGHPTVINNVETFANIPWIVWNGAEAYRELGTEKSPGTKIFCLTGDVKRTGFIEVPLGINTQVLVEKIGGASAKSIKALQIGGPAGGIIPYGDTAMDYETVASSGANIGSGGLVVLGTNRCLVDLARHLVSFMADESCGKCVVCRDGLPELEAKLTALTTGQAHEGILAEIEGLSRVIAEMALCGLGQTAANPVLTTLKYFQSEYEAHLRGTCPAIFCKSMISFEIIQTRCKDCRCCYLVCPSGAVSCRATGKERFLVDQQLCIRCWACYETCPFGCIKSTSGVSI
ncbi:MAG TPA: NADH-ubiquinone oxidoreductase-F iron-sulfur binding region domain-containing protein [Desulfuromonadaceae bacterium]